MPIIIILAIIVFLIMEHTSIFWLAFVPLALIFIIFLLKLLSGKGLRLSDVAAVMIVLVIMVVALVIVCIPS